MTRCGRPGCDKPLDPDGPSFYFCDDRCQTVWQREQGDPLPPPAPLQLPSPFPPTRRAI